MTATEKRRLIKLIADLRQCAHAADLLEINLENGAEVGSLVGTIADELEQKMADLD